MCDGHEDGKNGAFNAQKSNNGAFKVPKSKNGAFKVPKSKGVILAIWFISQILNEGQAVIHFASGRIVTCYTDYLDNRNEYMLEILSLLSSTRHQSSGSFTKHIKPRVERYGTARTKLLFNPFI
jgi:hypothetical protein